MADQKNERRENYFAKRAGTNKARFHVVPGDEKKWAVKEEDNDAPLYLSDARQEAVDEAKKLAEEAKTKVILHDEDGQIQEQINYD
jgi:hypothetical protein